jgi:hypothetical protein
MNYSDTCRGHIAKELARVIITRVCLVFGVVDVVVVVVAASDEEMESLHNSLSFHLCSLETRSFARSSSDQPTCRFLFCLGMFPLIPCPLR